MKFGGQKLLWLILFKLIRFSQQSSSTKLIATKAEISNYDKSILNVTFQFKTLPNDSYSLNFRSELFVRLDEFLVRVRIAMPSTTGKFDSIFMGNVADVCDYYRSNSTKNMFLRLFFNGHFGKKLFPSSCPIKPGIYYMEDFRIDDNLLKIRFIETKFLVMVDLCTRINSKNKCAVSMKVFGEIRDRQKWEKEVTNSHLS